MAALQRPAPLTAIRAATNAVTIAAEGVLAIIKGQKTPCKCEMTAHRWDLLKELAMVSQAKSDFWKISSTVNLYHTCKKY
jgi:hypothetical protein